MHQVYTFIIVKLLFNLNINIMVFKKLSIIFKDRNFFKEKVISNSHNREKAKIKQNTIIVKILNI